jgi:hypothetical protein
MADLRAAGDTGHSSSQQRVSGVIRVIEDQITTLRELFFLLRGPSPADARWRGLLVVAVDGTIMTVADSPANLAAYAKRVKQSAKDRANARSVAAGWMIGEFSNEIRISRPRWRASITRCSPQPCDARHRKIHKYRFGGGACGSRMRCGWDRVRTSCLSAPHGADARPGPSSTTGEWRPDGPVTC